MNREGLPLFLLANIRGFSGGQQDMVSRISWSILGFSALHISLSKLVYLVHYSFQQYDEILKQGAKIVDGLSQYKQPVFIYLPPNAELRGGAWVVLDPTINAQRKIEMFADSNARGGILGEYSLSLSFFFWRHLKQKSFCFTC